MSTINLHHFLRHLWSQGVEFWIEGEQLRFRGNKHLVSGDNLAMLRDNKAAIIEIIKSSPEAYLGFPLSHGQRGIYLMQQMDPESIAYNLTCLLELGSNINLAILENSLDFLLQRHAPLRMSIQILDGQLAQQVSYSLPCILAVTEMESCSNEQLQAWIRAAADKPFNLNNEPLIRARLLLNHNTGSCHFLLVAHHIVVDFWAMDLLVKELAIIYQAGLTAGTPTLPDIGKLYKDYVIHEQQWLQSEAGQNARQYWLDTLHPLPPALELPTDFKRPPQQGFSGKEFSFTISAELTARIREKAKTSHITPFLWVFSAYQILLHRYTGEQHIAIGSPMACRNQHDFQLLAGHFTNPVVLLGDFSTTQTFNNLLHHNKQQLLKAMKHQEYPLQILLEDIRNSGNINTTTLFQTAISWNQLSDNMLAENPLVKQVLLTEQRGAIYDLVLSGYDKDKNIDLSLRFNSGIFKQETIARFSRHFLLLLEQTCINPDNPISRFDFRTPEEIARLQQINNTTTTIAKNTGLAELFHRTALQHPQLIAFRQNDCNVSYAMLDARSSQLANLLEEQGIQPRQHIALCLNRSLDMLTGILAALKLGCIYVPIDSNYPNDRIAYMTGNCDAPILISARQFSNKLDEVKSTCLQTNILYFDDINARLDNYNTTFPIWNNGQVDDNEIASVLFTSGSTGKPKGVNIPHRAIIRLSTNTSYMAITPADKFCYLSNVSFDATNIEVWGSLLNGGCLLAIDTDTLLTPAKFKALLETEKPQAAIITTALFNVFIGHNSAMFRDFKILMVGGEALDTSQIRKCLQHGKPRHLLNVYGPTENGTVSSAYEITRLDGDESIPIGKPISNSQVYVHDRYGMDTPFGVKGEIVVGGEGISTGYLKQPELTAEKFIADHYRQKGLLYATGDLGYFREDGELIYVGRKDDQVKIRGYRIEPGEIEQRLSQHPDIDQCCITVNNHNGFTSLAAYYSSHTTIDSSSIKAFLRKSLPEFMIPAATLQMPALPINANGKIDKKALPAIIQEKQDNHVAPRNQMEKDIADIWQQMLQHNNISVFDNFFEAGGHSLLAIKVASALQDKLHFEITMRMLFEHPTIASLAAAIVQGSDVPQLPAISARNENAPVKAALSQQRLWFLQQLNPASVAYNMPVALRIVKPVQATTLESAIGHLIQRHESLRTHFIDSNGVAYLNIHTSNDWHLPVIDLSHLSSNDAMQQAKLALTQLAQHSFNLGSELLFKCLLIKQANTEHILAFCLHHSIADGISVNILLEELGVCWQQAEKNQPLTLPPLTITYSDFSAWQHQWLQGDMLNRQLAYWQQQLAGAPAVLNLPTDKPRPAVLGSDGAEFRFSIPAVTANKLRQLAQNNGATLFMTLLAAYSLLLSRYSQQNDLCIGFPIAGRTQKTLENMVGLFVNNLVVRCKLTENISINDYIQQIRQTTINAYAHQDIPFDMIIDGLKIERSLSYIPFLQASFSLENSHFADQIAQSLGSDVRHEPLDWHVAKYDIHLSCFETTHQQLEASIEYNTGLFEQATVEKISRHYQAILASMADSPSTSIGDLQFLSELEYQQQMDFSNGWNATAYEYPEANSLHSLFEAQAEATPNAIALADEQQRISYHQLNAMSNKLAHYLTSLGVTRNQPVAVCLDRSVNMSIALLAILKAGGAYVPLTTDIPVNRITFICNDTRAKVFISTSNLDFASLDIAALRINMDEPVAWQQLPETSPDTGTSKDDIFNIIYTSGSTGNPKGVMVPHRGIINRLRWMQYAYPIGLQDKVLQKTPFNFDVSVWELFWPLIQGSTLVFARPEGHKDPDYLRNIIISQGITTLHFVPSMLGVFLQTADIENCTTLRQVFASGEALQLGHNHAFYQRLPDASLINLYGPTEASIDVSYYNCIANEQHSSIAIGKPIHNTQLHILDHSLNVLPIGVAGDLYIGGEGLALGYWNQEELTRNAFIDNPWHTKGHPSKKLYKTGDVARYRSDGNIEYLGRSDHQIKIRGLRVELGEIETAIGKLPGIKECLVLLKQPDTANQRLVAYLLTDNMPPDTLSITQTLKGTLPEYMVPSIFIALTEWPLSPNGKIDRKRLPEPDTNLARQYAAPRNNTEQGLADIWSTLLDVEKIGIHDNFFELGGHSLLATQIASRIRKELDCSLELKAIFEHPTIAELAIHLLEQEVEALDINDADLLALLDEINQQG